jgi:chromosome segregation ATPase
VSKIDRKRDDSPLEVAATRMRDEIERFEALTDQVTKAALTSSKAIDRATELLEEAAQSHGRFGQELTALIAAVSEARDRQAASAERLNTRGESIRERRAQFLALRERFAALGDDAQLINTLILEAGTPDPNALGDVTALIGRLGEASERMATVVERAKELGRDAHDVELVDLEREADALRQKVAAARNKVDQLRTALEARRAPPN